MDNFQEDEIRIVNKELVVDDPPSYDEVLRSNKVSPMVQSGPKSAHWTKKFKNFWKDRPILLLFTVILLNGLISMAIAAIFIELEGPDQRIRIQNKLDLFKKLKELQTNLTESVKSKSKDSKKLYKNWVELLEEYHALPGLSSVTIYYR